MTPRKIPKRFVPRRPGSSPRSCIPPCAAPGALQCSNFRRVLSQNNPRQMDQPLSCSVTLENKGPLFGEDRFGEGAATKKKGKRVGATEQLSQCRKELPITPWDCVWGISLFWPISREKTWLCWSTWDYVGQFPWGVIPGRTRKCLRLFKAGWHIPSLPLKETKGTYLLWMDKIQFAPVEIGVYFCKMHPHI